MDPEQVTVTNLLCTENILGRRSETLTFQFPFMYNDEKSKWNNSTALKFDCDYGEWKSFFFLFMSSVRGNSIIPDCSKMLRSENNL